MQTAGRNIAAYITLPQVLPRVRGLFADGFGFVSFSIACVLGNARLFPPGHPYLNPQNIGRFGLHQVLAQAFLNIKFNKRNIDQMILLALVLTGCVLLLCQCFILLAALMSGIAHATWASRSLSILVFVIFTLRLKLSFIIIESVFFKRGRTGLQDKSLYHPHNWLKS